MKIRLAAPLQTDSIVDGDGIRAVIWTQGCAHHCFECHNPETHDFHGGFECEIEDLKKEMDQLRFHDGITLSGGDPLMQILPCTELARYAHQLGLNVWCYTGYTFEQLMDMAEHNSSIISLLEEIDVLIDGKFVLEAQSLDCIFRGSKNQRILDVKESLRAGKAIGLSQYDSKKTEKKESLLFI